MFQLPKESFDPYGELKAFKKDLNFRRIIKISGSITSMAKSAWAYLINRFYYKAHANAKLTLMIEQEPVEESYIGLSEKKDNFAIPEAVINWHITPKTWETAVVTAKELQNQIASLNMGNVILYDHINENILNWSDYLSDVCHHMGGSRMSSVAAEGVVNQDLQVWGIPNLYICSCSVFPTSSHSNPTLTLMALGIKLCDHLSEKSIALCLSRIY